MEFDNWFKQVRDRWSVIHGDRSFPISTATLREFFENGYAPEKTVRLMGEVLTANPGIVVGGQ